jgi:hypothetical protein
MKDENGDLLSDSKNILNRWKKYFSQLLNVHSVSDVRQVEIHTAEPFVPDRSEVKIAIAKLMKNKSTGSDRILADLSEAGSEILRSDIYKLINSISSKEELSQQRTESIISPVYKIGGETECHNERGMPMSSTS